jgi:transcription elongation factor Elf1
MRDKLKPTDTTCPACKQGILFDVTPILAQALNQKHVQCGKCGYRHGFMIPEKGDRSSAV